MIRQTVTLLIALAAIPAAVAQGPRGDNTREFRLIDPLGDITWVASQVDCYFTVEETYVHNPKMIPQPWQEILWKRARIKRDIATIDELVAELKIAYNDAAVFRDP